MHGHGCCCIEPWLIIQSWRKALYYTLKDTNVPTKIFRNLFDASCFMHLKTKIYSVFYQQLYLERRLYHLSYTGLFSDPIAAVSILFRSSTMTEYLSRGWLEPTLWAYSEHGSQRAGCFSTQNHCDVTLNEGPFHEREILGFHFMFDAVSIFCRSSTLTPFQSLMA